LIGLQGKLDLKVNILIYSTKLAMIETILKSVIYKIVLVVAVEISKSTWFSEQKNLFHIMLTYLNISHDETTLGNFRRKILQLILADQSTQGTHAGQFGKSSSHNEHKKWQTQGVNENPNTKPRMYLTYWPVLVLKKHNLAKYAVVLAKINIKNLFLEGKIIPVYRYTLPNTSPHVSRKEINPIVISYRHTMSGALILSIFEKWNGITLSTLDRMSDSRNNWQGDNGGWKQVSDDDNSTDIWASAYAVKILAVCLSSPSNFNEFQKKSAKELLNKTILFLEKEWNKDHWGFGKLSSEESSIPLYIELFEALEFSESNLIDDCITKFTTWLSPRGDLSENYKSKLSHVPEASLYARMAYAFYLHNPESDQWKILFDNLPQCDFKKEIYASDLAYILDMSFTYSKDDSAKIKPTFLDNKTTQ
jgi:hypothetical protein